MISTRSFVARKSAVSFMGAGEVTVKFAGALAWALLTTVIGVAPATSPCGTVTDTEVALAGVTWTAVVPKRTETGATKPAPVTATAVPGGPLTGESCVMSGRTDTFSEALVYPVADAEIAADPGPTPCTGIFTGAAELAGTAAALGARRIKAGEAESTIASAAPGAGIAWTVAVPDWLAASARPDGPSTRRGCITMKLARELEHPFRGQGGAWTKTMLSPQQAETSSMYDPGVSVRPAAAEPLCVLTVNWDVMSASFSRAEKVPAW